MHLTPPRRWLVAAAASALFVLVAVMLEVLAGTAANSAVPEWAHLVPATWPRPARVSWWLAVAGAGGAYRLSLHRLGLRPNRLVTLATVAPFLLFAFGIAIGSEWTAWH
ncbi:MAG: hypothetical protein M3N25_00055 [Actinomycetota bacterium]|nr:hypothetical protein [Actinomycetota bacterium]